MHRTHSLIIIIPLVSVLACNSGGNTTASDASGGDSTPTSDSTSDNETGSTGDNDGDITDAVFTERDPDCAGYAGTYTAAVKDLSNNTPFTAMVTITPTEGGCSLESNGIPNHDFGDGAFATPVSEVNEVFDLIGSPTNAGSPTQLSLMLDNAVFRNGVKLDLLAAACYGIGNEPLGNEKIGCMQTGTPWRYDPMSPKNSFGTDSHNAHTQPDGAYHYHGDPGAMWDMSGSASSGLIGWAADGFPIYGSYFEDNGMIRKAVSGYSLKPGPRVSQPGEGAFPGGEHDGTFIDDYEFTNAGDLDECNGMTVTGVYGYYVTDLYPWVLKCFKGTPDPSFMKMMP